MYMACMNLAVRQWGVYMYITSKEIFFLAPSPLPPFPPHLCLCLYMHLSPSLSPIPPLPPLPLTKVPGAREHSITSDDLFYLKKPPGKTYVSESCDYHVISHVTLDCSVVLQVGHWRKLYPVTATINPHSLLEPLFLPNLSSPPLPSHLSAPPFFPNCGQMWHWNVRASSPPWATRPPSWSDPSASELLTRLVGGLVAMTLINNPVLLNTCTYWYGLCGSVRVSLFSVVPPLSHWSPCVPVSVCALCSRNSFPNPHNRQD